VLVKDARLFAAVEKRLVAKNRPRLDWASLQRQTGNERCGGPLKTNDGELAGEPRSNTPARSAGPGSLRAPDRARGRVYCAQPERRFRVLSMMAADSRYLDMVVLLGREFVRRGMAQHARALLYYVALKTGLAGRGAKLEVRWDRALTEEWMKTLRVPPFERHYEVKLPGVSCFRCQAPEGNERSSTRIEIVFPGGARARCENCGARWLVDEGSSGQ
jgi:hypothetical protein